MVVFASLMAVGGEIFSMVRLGASRRWAAQTPLPSMDEGGGSVEIPQIEMHDLLEVGLHLEEDCELGVSSELY